MMTSSHITVLVLSTGDKESLNRSLASVSRQSLEREKFEALILFRELRVTNEDALQDVRRDYGDLQVQGAHLDGRADDASWRKILAKINGTHVVFLREGDWLSPEFLKVLLNDANGGVISLAQIAEVSAKGKVVFQNHYNREVLRRGSSSRVEPSENPELLVEIAAKLIPRHWLREELMSYALNGHHLIFNVSLAVAHDFVFSRVPASIGATYYRTETRHRSEQTRPEDASTAGSIETLKNLHALGSGVFAESKRRVVASALIWQMQATNISTASKRQRSALQEVASSNLLGLPREELNDSVKTLGIVANFAPYAGTAGIVAAKRIIERGKPVDLISSIVRDRRKQENDLLLTESYIRKHQVVSPGIGGYRDSEISNFIARGRQTLKIWRAQGAQYEDVYSRAMIPHSHFLAASIKRDNPEIRWIAEFSDPLSLTVEGKSRRATFEGSQVLTEFEGWGTLNQQRLLLEDTRIHRWAELLPYFFADTLIFTNVNQMKVMLDDAPKGYRDVIVDKAIVSHHPTLPDAYYRMTKPTVKVQNERISIAYFGDFHSTRGMGEVVDALESLSDEALRCFRLMIFTDSNRNRIHHQLSERVNEILVVQPKLSYLEFLSALRMMDVLIVNDSYTKEYFSQNPFLPSKVSDYRGTNTPIWAIVEPGSVMSRMDFSYVSNLGDVLGAAAVLKDILDARAEV